MKIVKRNLALLLVLSLLCSSYEGSSVLAADNTSDMVGSVEEAEFVDDESADWESEDAVDQGNEDAANQENEDAVNQGNEDAANSESENDSDSEKEDNSNLGNQKEKEDTDNDSSEDNENETGMENDSDSDKKTDESEIDTDVSDNVQKSEEIAAEKSDAMDVDSLLAMSAEDRLAAMSSADDIDGGFYEDVAWVIDVNGKLTVIGTGEFEPVEENVTSISVFWCRSADSIKSAEINVSGMTDASSMFLNCKNMESVDLSNFDTSKVTNMEGMFQWCKSLENVDLSSFDTAQVTNMDSMFYGCSSLTSLDVSKFKTSQVTDMSAMFMDCSMLQNLDLSNFDTSKVTGMSFMFYDCARLQSLDLGNFNTSEVRSMTSMFYGCESLNELDLSSFDTGKVTSMYAMFYWCSHLQIVKLSNFDTSKVVDMSYMFYFCLDLKGLDTSNFNTSKVKSMKSMFQWCQSLESLDTSSFDTSQVTNMDSMFGNCSRLTYIDASGFDTSQVTNMYYMFSGCSSLSDLDVSSFDTSQVTNMGNMFSSCSRLTALDVSGFDTGKVINMAYMFYNCQCTSLDISGFDTSNITSMELMFYGCSRLKSLDLSSFDTSQVINMGSMFFRCEALENLNVSSFDTSQVRSMRYMFAYCYKLKNLELSNFDTDQVINTEGMFIDCNSLESIDLSSFNTSQVTNMHSMFSGCSSLINLNLSNFDTSSVTYADYMLKNCNSLITINTPYNLNIPVSLPINTGEVWHDPDGVKITELPQNLNYSIEITKRNYFSDNDIANGSYGQLFWVINANRKLTVLGIGDFSESSGSERAPWYKYRTRIKSAEINVTGMTDASYMFYGCKNLSSLDLSGFDASNVTNMEDIFYNCPNLETINTPCNLILTVDLPGTYGDVWTFADGTEITEFPKNLNESVIVTKSGKFIFNEDDIANGIYNRLIWWIDKNGKLVVKGEGEFSDSDTKERAPWYQYRREIKSAEVDVKDMTDASYMFYACTDMENVDLSDFDTSDVINMYYMFGSCSILPELDLSNFNTNQVTDMRYMFYGCSSLIELDLSNFYTNQVTNMRHMFDGCNKLLKLNISSFNTSQVTNMNHMFSGCRSLAELDVSSFDTSKVTDMGSMFSGTSQLISLDVSSFDTSKVTDMESMFSGTSQLISLDLSSFNISNETTMRHMFYNCQSITELNLSSFNADDVYDMDGMFDYCSALTTIYTPYNVHVSARLPRYGKWYLPNGSETEKLPRDLNYSTVVSRDKVPDAVAPPISTAPYITVNKLKTRYVVGESLNIYDLTVTYYNSKGAASEVTDYSTNAAEIDMSTAGTKELVVTYKELTVSVNIYVTSGNKEGIKIELEDPDKTYIYTGTAITPNIKVTNNGEPLTEGIDYTVKYSNNIKASASAKITVTGKGNLTQSYTKLFTIEAKQLDNEDIKPLDTTVHEVQGDIVTVIEGSKISPVLLYSGTKLTTKDFKVPDEYKNYKWKLEDKNYESKRTITVTGQGNFQGTRTLTVKIISKADQKNYKLNVSLSKEAKNLTYDGQPKDIRALGLLTISTNNTPAAELIEAKDGENGDYIISYPNDITSAGTKKFTVTGISDRCIGTVTKSYTIKPRKAEFSVEYDKDNKGYDFVSTGTTIPDDELIVRDPQFIDGAPLIKGKDYKVSYSGNKKVGTAKITITGLGSYKGSKSTNTFTINKAVLNNNPGSATGKTKGLEIAVADKVFNKAGVYKSAPYVSIDGVLLKASNYTVTYYLDNPVVNASPRVMDSKNKVTNGEATVWVKIVGKGNYATDDETCYATASYRVRSKASTDSYDLSKAKVSFQDKDGNPIKKAEFNGEPITNDDIRVVVTYKIGSETVTLDASKDYTVTFVNNVNKGKVTVVITGRPGQNRYVGSKTASFSIVAHNLNNLIG